MPPAAQTNPIQSLGELLHMEREDYAPAFAVHTFGYLNGVFSDPMTQVFADAGKRTWLFNMDGHQDGRVVIDIPIRRYALTVIERRA